MFFLAKTPIFCAINRKIMSKQLEMADFLMGYAQTANQSQAGATNRSENIIILPSAFAQIFPRSQPMRESNTSTTH
jgi:hypothetical protein